MMRSCYPLGLLLGGLLHADVVTPVIEKASQPWVSADLWANPMEDWCVRDGGPSNTHSGGDRELVLLTAELVADAKPFEISATFHPLEKPAGHGFVGFQVGLAGEFSDFRDSAIYGTGMAAGMTADGRLFIAGKSSGVTHAQDGPVKMTLTGEPVASGNYALKLVCGEVTLVHPEVHPSWLEGLASFTVSSQPPSACVITGPRPKLVPAIVQQRGGSWRYEITGMKASGEKIKSRPGRSFGPLLWTQHTLENGGKLNLTAQFAPVAPGARASLVLDGKPAAVAEVDPLSRVAQFRVDGLDTRSDHPFAVVHGASEWKGVIRREPLEKRDLTIASMSCNDSTGFPHNLLVRNVSSHRPDIIAFLGDQIYEPIGGYGLVIGADNTHYDDRTTLCYLRKYYMHGWTWRELLRDTPSVTLPDDHDVFHGNIWGAGGKLADRSKDAGASAQDSGGYKMSVDFVNAVNRSQTGNLPKPVDPDPCGAGISVWFTLWRYAGIDMAVLGDRQFKSAPKALLPDSAIRNGWPTEHAKQRPALKNPRELDVPSAELLGPRQEAFLRGCSKAPDPGVWRLVFSATPLMALQTIPEDEFADDVVPGLKRPKLGEYPENDIPKLDYDANGWPQSKRDLAVSLITDWRAVHVTGDQHLGSTGQYGRSGFGDSAWWISSPAIANLWPRRWFPKDGGANRREGDPKYTGEFEDGFGNKITLHAAANPYDIDREPSRLYDKAVGYSIITLHRDMGRVTLANWPYYSAPENAAPDNRPYPGWPITIDPATNRRIR